MVPLIKQASVLTTTAYICIDVSNYIVKLTFFFQSPGIFLYTPALLFCESSGAFSTSLKKMNVFKKYVPIIVIDSIFNRNCNFVEVLTHSESPVVLCTGFSEILARLQFSCVLQLENPVNNRLVFFFFSEFSRLSYHRKKGRLHIYPPEFKIYVQKCVYGPEFHVKLPIILAC